MNPPYTNGILEQGRTNGLKFTSDCSMLYIIMRGEVKPCPRPKFVLRSIHVNNTTHNLKTKNKKTKSIQTWEYWVTQELFAFYPPHGNSRDFLLSKGANLQDTSVTTLYTLKLKARGSWHLYKLIHSIWRDFGKNESRVVRGPVHSNPIPTRLIWDTRWYFQTWVA